MRRLLASALLLAPLACGDVGGCNSDYAYPRENPGAEPTPRTMRGRLTEAGFQKLTSSIPDAVAAACADTVFPSLTAPCAVDDATSPSLVHFYLGTPGQQIDFTGGGLRTGGPAFFSDEVEDQLFGSALTDRPYCDDTGAGACEIMFARGFGASGDDFCRDPDSAAGCNDPATDYCCGDVALGICSGRRPPSCDTYRSSVAVHLDTLIGNVHSRFVDDGIEVILGCAAPNPDDCTDPSEYIRLSGDLSFVIEAGSGDVACHSYDDPAEDASFEVKTLRFIVRPRVVHDQEGRSRLVVDDSTVEVSEVELQIFDVVIDEELNDPACYDESWGYFYDGDADDTYDECFDYCPNGLFNNVLSYFASGVLGEYLAQSFARSAIETIAGEALESAGQLDARMLLPMVSKRASPAEYLIAASPETTRVAAGAFNLDLDTGFTGARGACAREAPPPVIATAPPPDPAATVMAPDPTTGALQPEPYDLALMMSRAMLRRAVYALYATGNLCLDVDAEETAALSPKFAPTIGTLSLIAPGLARLGPADAAIDLRLIPSEPPTVDIGSGELVSGVRDSHLKLAWSDVALELYPLVDDAHLRAIAFTATLRLAASLEALPKGDVRLVVDELAVEDIVETYNEMGGPFDAAEVSELIASFVPALVSGEPIDVELTAASLGVPFVPKLRAVTRLGTTDPYLAFFLRFCTAEELADTTHPLCFEGATMTMPLTRPTSVDERRGAVLATVPGDDELHFRVDGVGPYFRAERRGGTLALVHPTLVVPGAHRVELATRAGGATTFEVWIDPSAPRYEPRAETREAVIEPTRSIDEPSGCAAKSSPGSASCLTLAALATWLARRRQRAKR